MLHSVYVSNVCVGRQKHLTNMVSHMYCRNGYKHFPQSLIHSLLLLQRWHCKSEIDWSCHTRPTSSMQLTVLFPFIIVTYRLCPKSGLPTPYLNCILCTNCTTYYLARNVYKIMQYATAKTKTNEMRLGKILTSVSFRSEKSWL